MVAANRFKKDIGYYLLGIIVPGLLNAAIIPIIKHLLGTEIFGAYSLKFNFLLLLMSTLIGGICQSVIRFKVEADNNVQDFYKQIFVLVRNALTPIVLISFSVFYFYFHQTAFLSLVFSLCIIGGSWQNVLMAIAQANFQSKFILLSEGIRAFVFFILAILALKFIPFYQQELLFLSLLGSYLFSVFLLAKKNKINLKSILGIFKPALKSFNTKQFLVYGFPLSLWFAIYYLCTYLDKPLLAHDFGLTIQGNYQAFFDIIFRGITGIMSPFPMAVLPILTQVFKDADVQKGILLLRKLIGFQILLTIAGVLFYWFFGFNILANILNVPDFVTYKIAGLIMIVACMVWQIGLLNHKLFKLIKRTDLLLKFMITSLLIYLLSFIVVKNFSGNAFYYYTFPFLLAGICYNLLCILFKKKIMTEIENVMIVKE